MSGTYVSASTPYVFIGHDQNQMQKQYPPQQQNIPTIGQIQQTSQYGFPPQMIQPQGYISQAIPNSPPSGLQPVNYQVQMANSMNGLTSPIGENIIFGDYSTNFTSNFSGFHQISPDLMQRQQIPYQGVPIGHPQQLNYSAQNRKGTLMHSNSLLSQSTAEENPQRVKEFIQTNPHNQLDQFQDLEGLDIIRVQASRLNNLLDRIEILEREMERKIESNQEKDRDIEFWEKQFKILSSNRDDSERKVDSLDLSSQNVEINKQIQDKIEIEKKITIKLREIEECGEEIAYYKSLCVPNEDEYLEIKRLQQQESQLLQGNTNLNKQLIIVGHQSKQNC